MVFSALACFTITDLTNAANSIFSSNLKVVHVASMKCFHFIYISRNFQHVLFASVFMFICMDLVFFLHCYILGVFIGCKS